MIVFDIDDTLCPARERERAGTPGVLARAFGFELFMPHHLLDFLRSREDIALLSTWHGEAAQLAQAFGFSATVLLMAEYSAERGIQGKFDTIKALKPHGWADDQIKPYMASWCASRGIATVTPESGFVTDKQLSRFTTELARIEPRAKS